MLGQQVLHEVSAKPTDRMSAPNPINLDNNH